MAPNFLLVAASGPGRDQSSAPPLLARRGWLSNQTRRCLLVSADLRTRTRLVESGATIEAYPA